MRFKNQNIDKSMFWNVKRQFLGCFSQKLPKLGLECERLMGLPEGWTALGHKDEAISDYARYKALGNAIAVPCATYIMAGIAEFL
ncbi:DNA cytosine methyltransferase [Virgibacillus sp. 179-BFC.A HS]|uniref:DNA cytosine methyltransferase n=1 Tax=Tigheibacillus jepli TaxID=3035914 RepID=A0ABU5CMG6_9BACI|nr:DNA cytosine methyltransferase [Virgibacillus sp. 179-BFC.A HS]MDY0406645.1 DNA cytosine methyltransferase [Virgibacillus sp. 179-BFC.A HS]